MVGYRVEQDAMGEIKVAEEVYWGAQTQRSLENFEIGTEKMPLALMRSLVTIKAACAKANVSAGKLTEAEGEVIVDVCQAILATEDYDNYFPLSVWQTGSGTQTNMNVNEVIAHLANKRCPESHFHPNDHVNLSQSSNDVFPTGMKLAAYNQLVVQLLPELRAWMDVLKQKEKAFDQVIKIGRTHLQDATPLTFGQEISAWRTMIEKSHAALRRNSEVLLNLPIGGTAVGTGINAPANFGELVCQELAKATQQPYRSEDNKFYGLTSYQDLSTLHGCLRSLAGELLKIANDIRWLASGPRAGLGEITIPSNEPGSSIMPGKVNPTQAEALTMVAVQVMGNDTTIQIAASQGNFQLNVFKPVIILNFLQSVQLLAEGMASFRKHCLSGLTANDQRMTQLLEESLMLVTALTPVVGYQKSGEVAKLAFEQGLTIRAAAEASLSLKQEQLDTLLDPRNMIN